MNFNKFLSLIFVVTGFVTSIAQVSEAERAALIALYNSTNGDQWTNTLAGDRPWLVDDPTSDVSDWYGVSVIDNTVQVLSMQLNNLNGVIPPEIGDLTSLVILRLTSNSLEGEIPSSIGKLTNLINLAIGSNDLEGNIPAELSETSVESIYLQDNELTGSLDALSGLPLRRVNLGNNNFSNKIPSDLIGNNVNPSVFFYIENNNFVFSDFETEHEYYVSNVGSYLFQPQANVDQTETLTVAEDGTIILTSTALTSPNNTYQWYKDGVALGEPTSDKNLVIENATAADAGEYYFTATNSIVTGLTLTRNTITLEVTEGSGDTCRVSAEERAALEALYNSTDGANWTNTWDLSLTPCDWYGVYITDDTVTGLFLSNNNLIGEIPTEIKDLTSLNSLNLSNNNFLGQSIPSEIGEIESLRLLYLTRSNLVGQIPLSLFGLDSLVSLNLSYNNLEGNIPEEIGDLTSLEILNFTSNELSGTIPITLSKLTEIRTLNLGANQLEGEIPNELSVLSNLERLNLGSNQLTGIIPNELGDLSNLESLTLGQNLLSGTIPVELINIPSLHSLFLSNNNLSGDIPSEFEDMAQLTFFYVASNEFVFSDLKEGFIDIENFNFDPQLSLEALPNQTIAENDVLIIPAHERLQHPDNVYSWYKDGGTEVVSNDKDLNITSVTTTDTGSYQLIITNSTYPDLTLTQEPTIITVTEGSGDTCSVSAEERAALVALYNSTNGANWTNTWDIENTEPCDWYGVRVENDTVIRLELRNNNLSGSIDEGFVGLDNLYWLDLQNNALEGNIPTTLDQLVNLTNVYLDNNQFSGSIPSELGNLINLQELFLNHNKLSDEVPLDLTKLVNLQRLGLNNNELTEAIPNDFGNLVNLTELYLNNNLFSGSIPAKLGDLINLQKLFLNNNQLSNEIPIEIGNLVNLQSLGLNNNELTGTIPNDFGNFINLQELYLNNNQLYGAIPTEIGSFSGLTFFYVNTNNFVFDDLSEDLTSISTFGYSPQLNLEASPNQDLSGGATLSIPAHNRLQHPDNVYSWYKDGGTEVVSNDKDLNITTITTANAGSYQLQITNPSYPNLILIQEPTIVTVTEPVDTCGVSAEERAALEALYFATDGANWTNTWDLSLTPCDWYGVTINANEEVTALVLEQNNLIGSIPPQIDGLTNLGTLNLRDNEGLAGSGFQASILNMDSLRVLGLSSCNLGGQIPNGIDGLTLQQLYLDDNDFTGNIPSSLGNMTMLRYLDLGDNELDGEIPESLGNFENIVNFYLDNNNLSGSIPASLGNLSSVYRFSLYNNELDGEIPESLGNFSNAVMFLLSRNNLTGSIPASLGGLTSVISFSVSNNLLSGEIPQELEKLVNATSIGLGNNELTGSIPDIFDNLLALQVFNVGFNKLTGSLPESLTKLTTLTSLVGYYNNLSGKIPEGIVENNSDLVRFLLEHNNFVFNDFDPSILNVSPTFYINQYEVDGADYQYGLVPGDELVILANTRFEHPDNVYKWQKYNEGNDAFINIGIETKDLIIPSITESDFGTYRLFVTNPNYPALGIIQKPTIISAGQPTVCNISDLEKDSLEALYYATDGENWNNVWDINLTPCDWYGVTIENDKVIGVDLSDNNLEGYLPSEFFNLPYLQSLNLSKNTGLTGTGIPSDIGNLVSLNNLNLNACRIGGEIPWSIGNLVNLNSIDLQFNDLTGEIPTSIGSLTSLEFLIFNYNELSGSIPDTVKDMISLEVFRVAQNNFSGKIPENFNELPSLHWLSIDTNNFVFNDFDEDFLDIQTFPYNPQANVAAPLSEITTVLDSALTIKANNILQHPDNVYAWYKDGGTVAVSTEKDLYIENVIIEDKGSYQLQITNPQYPDLTLIQEPSVVSIIENSDSCGISEAEYSALVDLYSFTNGSNWNTIWNLDQSPCEWYGVTIEEGKVTELNLEENNLVGSLPSSIANLINLEKLYLANNSGLAGSGIPEDIGNLINLEYLNLGYCNLGGTIPSSIGNLTNLTHLGLGYNALIGTIPEELGNLSEVQYLWLKSNELEGELPANLENLTSVTSFDISHNNISGTFPELFSSLENLETLYLLDNELGGDISNDLLESTNLSILGVGLNNFVFNDFNEQLLTLDRFSYLSQANLAAVSTELIATVENPLTIQANSLLQHPDNRYSWFKDGDDEAISNDKDLYIENPTSENEGTYQLQITNPNYPDLTLLQEPTVVTTVINYCDIAEEQKLALWALYESTGGQFWTNTQNGDQPWDLSIPVCEWYGLGVGFGSNSTSTGLGILSSIDLSNNNLTGYLPPELGVLSDVTSIILSGNNLEGNPTNEIYDYTGMTKIATFDVSNNQLSGNLPEFTTIFSWLDIKDNNLVFNDLRDAYANYNTSHIPQADLPADSSKLLFVGDELIIYGNERLLHDSNEYQWYKLGDDGEAYVEIEGATEKNYIVESVIIEDAGIYKLEVTNTLLGRINTRFNELTLTQEPTIVIISDDPDNTGGTASLCTEFPYETIADLPIPDGVEAGSVTWYEGDSIDDEALDYDDEVYPLMQLYYSTENSEERVEFVLQDSTADIPGNYGGSDTDGDGEIEEGEDYQIFLTTENPTPSIGDLIITADSDKNVTWHASKDSIEVLSEDTLLVDGGVYYAAYDSSFCRFDVEVDFTPGYIEVAGSVIFCASENPTIATLELNTVYENFGATVRWYSEAEGGELLEGSTALEDGEIYYATLYDSVNNIEEIERQEVFVEIMTVPAVNIEPITGLTVYKYEYEQAQIKHIVIPGTVGNLLWYSSSDREGDPLGEDQVLEENVSYYATQYSANSDCESDEVIEVTVQIENYPPPEVILCEKFRPQVGSQYVFNGWVRQHGVKLKEEINVPLDEDVEVSTLLVDLLNDILTDFVFAESVPGKATKRWVPNGYIPDPDNNKYDPLIRYIEDSPSDVLKIYDFDYRYEDHGIKRAIGFEFSFTEYADKDDEDHQPDVIYETPLYNYGTDSKVSTKRKFPYEIEATEAEHYPLFQTNKDAISLEFTGINQSALAAGEIKINADFRVTNGYKSVSIHNKNGSGEDEDVFYNDFVLRTDYSDNGTEAISNMKLNRDLSIYEPDVDYQVSDYTSTLVEITYEYNENEQPEEGEELIQSLEFHPTGVMVDGWQQVTASFVVPEKATYININLKNESAEGENVNSYFDDIRVHPYDSNLKTFVYDPETQLLRAELDENNFATFYEYDNEGGLIRVKKETERGVYTIQETRSNTSKVVNSSNN